MICNAGAREVQANILAKSPNARVAVYTVWFNMLPDDSRSRWKPVLTDQRVTNLWDEQRLVGRLLANGRGYAYGAIYDWYFLYGPEATWTDRPSPPQSSGTTVIDHSGQLRQAVQAVE